MASSGRPLTTMPPWREDGNVGTEALAGRRRRGWRPSGERRSGGRLRLPGDDRIERRWVRIPVWAWSMAAQFLLGRFHRGDGVGRLTLRLRKLLDVLLKRLDLAPQLVDLLRRRRRASRIFRWACRRL